MKIYPSILFCCLLLSSCSCLRRFSGIVYSEHTKKPLVGAKVSILNKNYQQDFFTDSTGYVEAYLHGGCKCPRVKVAIEAESYQKTYAKEPKRADTVNIFLKTL